MKPNYRLGAQAIIFNANKEFLVVQLKLYNDNEWNFVGGGREGNESDIENIFREIKEELNLEQKDFEIIGKSSHEIKYDFPNGFVKENPLYADSPYTGQIKEVFVIKFVGNVDDIKIEEESIKNHKWIKLEDMKNHLIFPNQFDHFMKVYEEFEKELS